MLDLHGWLFRDGVSTVKVPAPQSSGSRGMWALQLEEMLWVTFIH